MGTRITRLSTEVATRSEIGRVLYDEDVKLRENLERSEIYKQKKKAKSPSAGIVLPQSKSLFVVFEKVLSSLLEINLFL